MDDNEYDILKDKDNLIKHLKSGSIENVCRSCLCICSKEDLSSLPHNTVDDTLLDKFTFVTSIQVNTDDCLPTHICKQCSSDLLNSFLFKTKTLAADNFLKLILKCSIKEDIKFEDEHLLSSFEQSTNEAKNERDDHEEVEYLEDFSDGSATEQPHIPISYTNEEKIKNRKVLISEPQFIHQKPSKKYCKRKKNNLECKLCSKIFFKQKTLRAHVIKDHAPPLVENGCLICKKSFPSEHDLRIHSSIHQSGNEWKCNECSKEFKDKQTLMRHVKRHMLSKRYSCQSCDKSYTELYALRRHNRVHTGEMVEKRHKCNVCEKRFNTARTLASHLTRHAGLRPFVCAVCGKTFPDKRLLSSHRLVHTDRKLYACDYCDKRFRHESTRNTHHRTHTGEKPYICSYCGKRFIQNSNLRLHLRTHTGEKPYSCDICQTKFTSGSSLKTHKRIHTGEKPYSCEICGMRFARMDKTAHMRRHTGERPFECSVCRKKFVTASSLKEHQRLHTGEKPYECDICSSKYMSKSRLAKHIKTHQVKVKTVKKSKPQLLYLHPVTDLDSTYHLSPNKIQYVKKEKEVNSTKIVKEKEDGNTGEQYRNISVIMETPHDVPVEFSRELIVNPDGETKEMLVADEANYQSNFCLASNIVLNDDVKFVTVDSDVSMPATSIIQGTTVKFMQVDQSLLQIQSENGQVTVSKITSKMTANF